MKNHGWSLKCIIKIDWKEKRIKKKRNTKKYKYNSTNKEKSNDREWLAR